MKPRVSDALAQLRKVNEVAIRDAGPRYTAGLDPGAPNIQIGYLVDAFDALSLVEGWRVRAQGLAERIGNACEHHAFTALIALVVGALVVLGLRP